MYKTPESIANFLGGLVYCVKVCSSSEQAKRIVNQLNQIQ